MNQQKPSHQDPSDKESAKRMTRSAFGPYLPRFAALGAAFACLLSSAQAQQIDNQTYQTNVDLNVLPIAEIEIIGGSLLYLSVPPSASTIPSAGVNFRVTGNASATMTAEPDGFVTIPTFDYPAGEEMGRAELNGNPVGYRLRLDFPSQGAVGSPVQFAGLPGYAAGPTEPPLTVNLMSTSGVRNGRIHLEASHEWTPDGGLPLPGIYVGEVVLTVTAN
jgi:hypothetical protein